MDGENVMRSADNTVWLTGESPDAEAVMVAGPNPIPFTFGWKDGLVAPPGIRTFEVTVTLVVSLLTREIKIPPAGAGFASAIGKLTDWPTFTVTFAGRRMTPVVFVSEKLAGAATPFTFAATV